MFIYYNANPLGKRVNDCTVRAISFATDQTWDDTYEELIKFARPRAIMPDEADYIDEFLEKKFEKSFCQNCRNKKTVGEVVDMFPRGTYLITMKGHITCIKDGSIYDTFDPSSRYARNVYKVK